MAQGEKFLFDVTFDVEQPPTATPVDRAPAEEEAEIDEVEEEPPAPTFTEEELDVAREEGYAAGREAGISDAASGIETRITELLGKFTTGFDEIFAIQKTRDAETFETSVNIALAVTRKCFPYLTETHGVAEIAAMVREILADIADEPKAIINVPPELQPTLETRIASIAQQSGFEGRISVLADTGIGGSDCRIDWTGGGAERSLDALWRQIDEIVEHNLGKVTTANGVTQDQTANSDSAETEAAAPEPQTNSAAATAIEADTPAPTTMPETSAPPAEPSPEIASEASSKGVPNTPDFSASGDSLVDPTDPGELVAGAPPAASETAVDAPPASDTLDAGPTDVEPDNNGAILTGTVEDTEDGAASTPSNDGEDNG